MGLSAGTSFGSYEVLEPIGAGGMGELYKARDTRLDRTVAIKVLPEHVATNPDLKQRFEREARAVAAFNHPNICKTPMLRTTGLRYRGAARVSRECIETFREWRLPVGYRERGPSF